MANGDKRKAKTIKTGGIKKSPLINPIDYDSINFKNKDIDKISYGSRLARMQKSLPTPDSREMGKTTGVIGYKSLQKHTKYFSKP